jgi:flagella basal body P-ring formation protein FlgA
VNQRRLNPQLFLVIFITLLATPVAAWVLELPESCEVSGLTVTLGQIAQGEIPAEAAELVLVGKGTPGRTYTVERRGLLRKLTSARLARGVVLRGADKCQVTLAGQSVSTGSIETALLNALQVWLPPASPGGPDAALALTSELPEIAVTGQWTVSVNRTRQLLPGRNPVTVEVHASHGVIRFSAVVECHVFGEIAKARVTIAKGETLTDDMFTWEWSNLSQIESGLSTGRERLQGMATAKALQAGDYLRESHVRKAPLVFQGEPVELVLGRGGVEVTLRGTARQDGAMNQIISVRNELDGHLVTAKVTGPGRVAWRK